MEGLTGDEQRHGETDAGEGARAGKLVPGVFSGLHEPTEFHGESRSGDQSQWFADRQADHDREHDRLMAEKRAGGNCDAGIGESE